MLRALGISAVLLGAVACASSTPPPSSKTELQSECEKNAAHDARCIEVLTSAPGGYESREAVMNKEASREADEFHARLARLRRAEDERQKARLQSSRSSSAADPLTPLIATTGAHDDDDDDSASSVRALRAAPDKPLERAPTVPRHQTSERRPLGAPEDRARTEAAIRAPEPPARIVRDPPTPEAYLRASICVITGDYAKMKAILAKEKRAAADQATLGPLALLIVETDTLTASIRDEMHHRGLPPNAGNCTTQPLAEVVDLLRTLVGPAVEKLADASTYSRGLARLRSELEVRAGLPKLE